MKKISALLVLIFLFVFIGGMSASAGDQVSIRIEETHYYLDELEDAKEILGQEKVQIGVLLNDQEFASGSVGLNAEGTGIQFIWVPHEYQPENPRFVRGYNRARISIYELEL